MPKNNVRVENLLSLLNGEFSSLSITFNQPCAYNYQTVRDYYTEEEQRDLKQNFNWVSQEEKNKAFEENSVWTIQWYPETPVGFYSVMASTLAAAIKAVLTNKMEDNQ